MADNDDVWEPYNGWVRASTVRIAEEIAERVLTAAVEPNSGLAEPLRAALVAYATEAKEVIQRCARAVLE